MSRWSVVISFHCQLPTAIVYFDHTERTSRIIPTLFVVGMTVAALIFLYIVVQQSNRLPDGRTFDWPVIVAIAAVYAAGVASVVVVQLRPQRIVLDDECAAEWRGRNLKTRILWNDMSRLQIYREKGRMSNYTYLRMFGKGGEIELASGGDSWTTPQAREVAHIAARMIHEHNPSGRIEDEVDWLARHMGDG